MSRNLICKFLNYLIIICLFFLCEDKIFAGKESLIASIGKEVRHLKRKRTIGELDMTVPFLKKTKRSPMSLDDMISQNTKIQENYDLVTLQDLKHGEFYEKLLGKENFPGYFIGVQTTQIACRFGCPAGPPLAKNTVFSRRLVDLIGFGFRECKRCKPLSYESPEDIQPYLDNIQLSLFPEKENSRLTSEAATWIEREKNIDLLRYVQVKRVNYVLKNQIPLSGGLETTLYYKRLWTPLGFLLGCFSNKGLCLLEFMDRRMLETELLGLRRRYKAEFKPQTTQMSEQLEVQLREYFQGTRTEFTIPLDITGSPFQKSVWEGLLNIPYGTTRSYKQQAIALNKPEAIRAVSGANGKNSISILVPCHRVIGHNQELTGYGGGLERKQYLLNLEASVIK